MHWCPYCGEPCYCDGYDTDRGEFIPNELCPHFLCDVSYPFCYGLPSICPLEEEDIYELETYTDEEIQTIIGTKYRQ